MRRWIVPKMSFAGRINRSNACGPCLRPVDRSAGIGRLFVCGGIGLWGIPVRCGVSCAVLRIFLRPVLRPVAVFRETKNPQSVVGCGFQTFGAPEGTRTPASGSGGLRDIHFTTGAQYGGIIARRPSATQGKMTGLRCGSWSADHSFPTMRKIPRPTKAMPAPRWMYCVGTSFVIASPKTTPNNAESDSATAAPTKTDVDASLCAANIIVVNCVLSPSSAKKIKPNVDNKIFQSTRDPSLGRLCFVLRVMYAI